MENTTLVYIAGICVTVGLATIVLARHEFFSTATIVFTGLPNKVQQRLTGLTVKQLQKSQFFNTDQLRIVKQLNQSDYRFRNKPITLTQFITITILSSLTSLILSVVYTAKFGGLNIPMVMIATLVGFSIPRWILMVLNQKKLFCYQSEVAQSFYILTTSVRCHSNLQRAIEDCVPNLPKYTRRLLKNMIDDYYSGKFYSFSEMLVALADRTQHPHWKEFAQFAMTVNTTGIRDRVTRMASLTSRAEQFTGKQKDERKGLKHEVFKVVLPFVILYGIIIALRYKDPIDAIYLYTTPIGKLLTSIIFLTTVLETLAFTWYFYEV